MEMGVLYLDQLIIFQVVVVEQLQQVYLLAVEPQVLVELEHQTQLQMLL